MRGIDIAKKKPLPLKPDSSNDDFFSKNHRVEAFDSTAVVLTGGLNGGKLIFTVKYLSFS